jgi:GTP-binding protein
MKTIALIGRPNVGKSSLFNVLTKTRNAIVADIPGLTRDRHYSRININNSDFLLVDTGGLESFKSSTISLKIIEQTQLAIDESDIIFLIVDGRLGLHPQDNEITKFIRKKNKPTLLIINKSEGLSDNQLIHEFSSLGFKEKICISSSHKEGISQISDFISSLNYVNEKYDLDDNSLNLSIVGKPNVGKSTLINAFLGEDRFIAFDQPGTTRDSISANFVYKNKSIRIIDTAGIRKKGKVFEVIEKFSIIKALLSIEQSNACILVIDACEGLTSQDLQILSYIIDLGKPLVLAFNKWDLLDSYNKENLKMMISKKNHFLNNYEFFYISALKKSGINSLLDAIFRAYKSSSLKIKTSTLNSFLIDLQVSHQPPIFKGIRPKLKYAHQGDICPPTIIIHGNHLSGIKKDYLRFIETSLIKTFKLIGTTVRIKLVESSNPFEKNEEKTRKIGLVTRRKNINEKREKIKKRKNKLD